MSVYYILGIVVGIAVCLILALIIAYAFRKSDAAEYDERQKVQRLKAYSTAFWVLVCYVLINGIADMMGYRWADAMMSGFVGICIACMVFVVRCIIDDAYFAVNKRPRFYMVLFGVICGINVLVTAVRIREGDSFFTDGLLNYKATNALCVGMFLILFIAVAIRWLWAKRRGEDE